MTSEGIAERGRDKRGDVITGNGLIRHEPARQLPSGPRTIPETIAHGRRSWPDRMALVGRHARHTYAELADEVAAATGALRAIGVRRGDRVAATPATHTDIVVAFFPAQALGAVWVGVNRNLAAPEKRFILEDSGSAYYLADRVAIEQVEPLRESLPDLQRLIEMEPGDRGSPWARLVEEHRGKPAPKAPIDPYAPAGIAYTSGTTGFPKGVAHSQHNMVMVGAMQRLAGVARPVDRTGVALPITILNLMILGPIAAFQCGRTCVMMDRIDAPGLAEWIREERIETFAAVPTIIYDLMTNPEVTSEDLKSLRAPAVGAAAMPESFRALYRERFGQELGAGYGLTEAPTTVTATDPEQPVAPGSSGAPFPHLRLSIQDSDGGMLATGESGEICIGAAVEGDFAGLYTPMLGYWGRPDATVSALRDGWLHTGDVGRVDEAGNLYVEGRRNDVLLRGGANVYPAEVERVLHMDDRVAACAVVGRADARLGERVVAFVQPAAGTQASEPFRRQLEALCSANLARYKTPDEWIFVTDMPRNAMNKIIKADLKQQYFG